MAFANYADEIKFMTVDGASRRLGQIADELDAREKALEVRVKNVEDRLKTAEDQIAKCCAATLRGPAPNAEARSPEGQPSSTNP